MSMSHRAPPQSSSAASFCTGNPPERRVRRGGADDPVDRESPEAGDRSDRQGERHPRVLPEPSWGDGREYNYERSDSLPTGGSACLR